MLIRLTFRAAWQSHPRSPHTPSPTLGDKLFYAFLTQTASILPPSSLLPDDPSFCFIEEMEGFRREFQQVLISSSPYLLTSVTPFFVLLRFLLLWVNSRTPISGLPSISSLLVYSKTLLQRFSLLCIVKFSLHSIFPRTYKYAFISATLKMFKNAFKLPSLPAVPSSLFLFTANSLKDISVFLETSFCLM